MTDTNTPDKPRRQKSTGSQRLLPSGRYEVRETRGGKTLSRTGASVTEARGRLRDAWRDVDRGARNLGSATFGPYATAWLETATASVKPYTAHGYDAAVRIHLIPAFGDAKLTAITHSDVVRWLVRMGRTHRANSLRVYRSVLAMICEAAVRDGLIVANPARGAPIPRAAKAAKAAHRLTTDEARRLLVAAQSHPFCGLWTLAAASGMRHAELLGLRWEDVDFAAARIHVRVQLQRIGGRYVLSPPKSERGTRTIAMTALVRDALLAHRAAQERERVAAGTFWDGSLGLCFTTSFGTPVNQSYGREQLRLLCAKADVPLVGPHALRHYVATALADEGVPMHDAMALLGHSSPVMTSRYTHAGEAGGVKAAAVLESALAPAPPRPKTGRYRRERQR